jgi:hypothetical protein
MRFYEIDNHHQVDLYTVVPSNLHPPAGTIILRSYVEPAKNTKIWMYAWGDNVFVDDHHRYYSATFVNSNEKNKHGYPGRLLIEDVEPFVNIEVIGQAYHKQIKVEKRRASYHSWNNDTDKNYEMATDTYDSQYDYYTRKYGGGIPWNYLKVKASNPDDNNDHHIYEMKFKRPDSGTAYVYEVGTAVRYENNFFGIKSKWFEELYSSTNYWAAVMRIIKNFSIKDAENNSLSGPEVLLKNVFRHKMPRKTIPSKGVKGIENRKAIKKNLEKLRLEQPFLYDFYNILHDQAVRGGISNNNLLSAFLQKSGAEYDSLHNALKEAVDKLHMLENSLHRYYEPREFTRSICMLLPGARDRLEEKRAKKQWQYHKGLKAQAEALGIDQEKYKLLFKAVEAGDIPVGIFHKAGDQDSLVNVEFDLWEKALKRDGWADVLYSMAADAARRTTYERNVTPYISFLFRLEKYLDKNTPRGRGYKKWKAFPKFVNSQWELEMSEDTGQTVKQRSALTPLADNENRTITVPYAALAIHGRQTTYCYSLNYYVFEDNMIDPESETPVVNGLERKLNGRDDYGLMFYTLTGTNRNTGYPTFLIIFERLSDKTRVHFHRVHPSRIKEGRKVPASRLIGECYRYMAGNVKSDEIYAQQGDLMFIKTERDAFDIDGKPVESFESHAFVPSNGSPVLLFENTSKSIKNRLGFIRSDSDFVVDHPEHEPLENMPSGVYEVRRAKSWEANPQAVWSFTID